MSAFNWMIVNHRCPKCDRHEQGLTIMESIKVLISDYGMSLREAKEIVSIHPVWTEVVKATGPLHNTLIEIWESPEKEHFD